jgi:hypothetical protein
LTAYFTGNVRRRRQTRPYSRVIAGKGGWCAANLSEHRNPLRLLARNS